MSEEYLDVQRLVVRPALEEQLASARTWRLVWVVVALAGWGTAVGFYLVMR